MKRENDELLFSPSDLVLYMQSPFSTWIERLSIVQPQTKSLKDKPDALLQYPADKGLKHEANYLSSLESVLQNVVTIADSLNNQEKNIHHISFDEIIYGYHFSNLGSQNY
ncbi:hypothetical protein [Paraglaciecola aestuariivivens]